MAAAQMAVEKPILIQELIELSGDAKVVYQQRASQALSFSVEYLGFQLSKKQIDDVCVLLSKKNLHPAVARNGLKILELQEIPKAQEGFLVDYCFNCIMNPQIPIAIRAFAMPVLYKIALSYPELKQEFKLVLEGLSDNESPGIQSRKRKYLRLLNDNG